MIMMITITMMMMINNNNNNNNNNNIIIIKLSFIKWKNHLGVPEHQHTFKMMFLENRIHTQNAHS